MSRGWFLTFEGGEGTGKSTQLGMLGRRLSDRGFEVVATREPGGTPLAEAIRSVLLDPALSPDGLAEIFLLEAARRDHVERVIRPALERGAVVLSDRFTDSSLVYQGIVRGIGRAEVARLNRLATGGLEPDLTLIFDVEPRQALGRVLHRSAASDLAESRLDQEPVPFHEQVRQGYLELARSDPDRYRVVDASGPTEEVARRVLEALPEGLR